MKTPKFNFQSTYDFDLEMQSKVNQNFFLFLEQSRMERTAQIRECGAKQYLVLYIIEESGAISHPDSCTPLFFILIVFTPCSDTL